MSGWPRRTTAFVLAVVLAAGVSCTSDDALGPSEPSAPAQMMADDQQSLLLGGVLDEIKSTQLLSCSEQPYVAVTKVIGPGGGTIVVGTHKLVIPAGALARDYTIRAEQMRYRVNSVRLWPEGLRTFIVGYMRWVTRLEAYVGLLTDRYPPFSLE